MLNILFHIFSILISNVIKIFVYFFSCLIIHLECIPRVKLCINVYRVFNILKK